MQGRELLTGLIALLSDARTMNDLTAETIGRSLGLTMQLNNDGDPYADIELSQQWRLAVNVIGAGGPSPVVLLSAQDSDGRDWAEMADVAAGLDLDQLAAGLTTAGYRQQTGYGEHGQVEAHDFIRDPLRITVRPRPVSLTRGDVEGLCFTWLRVM
jgi:hypothetical protein